MSDIPEVVFAALVAEQARALPDLQVLTFLAVADGGEYIEEVRTCPRLYGNGQSLAREFLRQGIRRQDHIALMMNNHPEFVETMVAASIVGATFVPVDPRTMGAKLIYMLDFTDCKGLICADYCLGTLLAVAGECPQLEWAIVVSTGKVPPDLSGTRLKLIRYEDVLSAPGEELPINEQSLDEPMYMMFTSGTSGNPKAVIHTHRDYMALATSMKPLGLNGDDKLYTGLPLTHVNAQNFLRNGIALGVPVVISRKFTKSRLWDICRRYRCSMFSLLGGMIPEIYAMPEKQGDADNPVRLIFSSGMPADLWKKFERRFGVAILEGYGSTEGGALSNPPGVGPVGSIGRPPANWQAEILDEDGNPCPPGVEGEICFRRCDGAPIVVRYYKNDEASAYKIRGGWLHMGDLGHRDENGWFYFHHRVGGGVRRNGEFVNTTLVESVLIQSPLVSDVFVYGVATEKNVSGEKTLVAAIVPADPSTFREVDLLEYCRRQLERNDVPEIIQVMGEIPKTITEKPIEKDCIDLLRQTGSV